MSEALEKSKTIRILAFESSCDDTSIAALEGTPHQDEWPRLLSFSVQNQNEVHEKFGGVVPELAARAHLQNLIPGLRKVLAETRLQLEDFDAFAATARPGLVGSLLIGHTAAKTLSLLYGKPFISCHHLEAHLHSIFLEFRPVFPLLAAVVSGGHSSVYRMDSADSWTLVAQTLDDAIGEAFDKGAKLLGLGFPGGAALERLARTGSPSAFEFSEVRVEGLAFSFSGLKTQLLRTLQSHPNGSRADVAASYQRALLDHLVSKLKRIVRETKISRLSVIGGVACNQELRSRLENLKSDRILQDWYAPELRFCTDNAVMVGVLAYRKFLKAEFSDLTDDIGSTQRPELRRARQG